MTPSDHASAERLSADADSEDVKDSRALNAADAEPSVAASDADAVPPMESTMSLNNVRSVCSNVAASELALVGAD